MSASLASVLRPGKTYTVSDDQYLTLFHKKFWGTSMQAEEVEWRRAQSAIGRGERNEESYQSADVSMEGDVEDEDSLPGCYYLDIDIEGLQPQGLWIRPDYVRIYDALHRDYPLPMDMDLIGKTPCAVITGQPGIGSPLSYTMDRRLRLFVEDGVYDVPDGWQKSDFRYFIWTFVDTDANKEGMPSDFVRPSTPSSLYSPDLLKQIAGIACTKQCKSPKLSL
ncbi:hypothetical protein BS47DRAFT_1389467 [Hydnum rufescens UP504]|uniref:Uncharacterized protein n=1 Tax=Hydnum rufescens UP504 TaxID=1448309 RepID=A0A9P6B863_9AGAM|nr:hypothetical protein BS47DRAFT_1389467 [Hydnum rufescens UP504]